jgi:hypothetical protein
MYSHGFTTTGPISTPEASSDVTDNSPNSANSANSANSNTSMVRSTTSSPTLQDPATGHSKEGPVIEKMGHGQSQAQGAGSMLSVHQQQQLQQSAGALQRPPSSASTSSAASFHTGASSVVHHPPHHHHASAQMGGNNHIPPQYRHPNHHHPHAQSHHIRHGEQMMGAVRGQGHPLNHGQQHMQNNNYHQPGLVRPAGRYPVQHSVRGGDGYGSNVHMHGHVQHGRPGPVSNYQFHQQQQQQHQYHSFPPQGPHAVPGPIPAGMDQVGSRGPSPTSHQQQPHHHPSHTQKSQSSVPPGVAVAIAQSQPLRRLSTNENANNAASVNNGAAHGDPNHTSNFRGHSGSHQAKQQPTQQHQQQQQSGPGQSPPNPHVQDHDMGGQEHHRHHPGPSAMHQRYPSHQLQHQHPQHDQLHYGGQPSTYHGVHPNGMHTDMHHYNYHHPSQGGAGPLVQNQYHGHPDNRFPGGYPHRAGGHGEMYPHGHLQHHFQHQQHQPNGYGQPLPHPSPPLRAPGHGFQLPKYNASRATGDMTATASKTDSAQPMSRSPSPPPSPPPAPSAQALLRQKLREQGAKKDKEQPVATSTAPGETGSSTNNNKGSDSMSISEDSMRRNSSGSHTSNTANKPMALGDRGNVAATTPSFGAKKPVTETTNKAAKTEDITADAASILLQLSGGPENQNPSGQSSPPIPSSVRRSPSMDDVSEAGTMLTMHTEAPDLTSEPSTDSIDSESNIGNKPVSTSTSSTVSKQFVESDFPCAVPDRYPTRLALPCDRDKLNTLHCFLRSELLEIFVVSKSFRKSPCHSPSSSVGRVGLRCVHCAMLRGSRREDREDAPMAVFYPKSIAEIYRLVTSWQRCHLRKCKNVPPAARTRWQQLRETDRSRGKTHYWVTSAKQIGLMDCQSRAGGIRFAPDFDPRTLPVQTILTQSSNEAAEKAAAITAKAQKIVSMANAVAASSMPVVPENAEMTDASNNAPTVMAPGAIRI